MFIIKLKFAVPDRKSKDWVEYGCHCFSDIKTDLLTPGTGRAIDKIGLCFMLLAYRHTAVRS